MFLSRKLKKAADGAGSSAKDPPKPLFTRGIKVLHTCDDAIVDICFVHGLTGDRETTWTAKGQQLPWPQTLLPSRLPNARILTFGYDAYVASAGPVSTNGIVDHATNLVNDLVGNRELCNATSNGLILVAHSLGGLVCKSALEYSRSNPGKHLRNVFEKLVGIIFLGTPHRGSWMANWAKIPVSALGVWQSGNTKLIDVLRTKSELLEMIRESFSRMIWGLKEDGREIKVTCFYEEMPLPIVGLVVPKESATLESSSNFSVHQDHRNMVKFSSEEDADFLKILYELKRWSNSIEHAKPAIEAPLSVGVQSLIAKSRREPPRLIPLDKNSNFSGRAFDLKRLRQMAAPKEQATTRVAIAGLGGIGKTQLALEYVYQQGREHPDCAVFWISCVSRETIDQGYHAVVHVLGDDGKVDKTDKADDLAMQKLLRDRLSRKDSGRWVLVFDNVDDISFWKASQNTAQGPRGLIDCLPRSELGTILFTTRNQQIAVRLAGQNVVKLTEMDADDSRQLLQKLLVDKELMEPGKNEETEKLLSSLMCLPLAIAQAAHYININGITISDYLGLLDAQEEQTIEVLGRDFEDGQTPRHPVATTWLISFKRLKTETPLAADYISFMACMDSKDIPESLLPSAPSPLAKTEAIGTLKAYSFVSRHSSPVELLSMHRLVHLAARNWLRMEETLDTWTDKAMTELADTLYNPEERRREEWGPSMPHAYYVLSQRNGPILFDNLLCDLVSLYANCLYEDDRFRDAERYYEKYLHICQTQKGASHPKTLIAMNNLVMVYSHTDRLDKATKLGQETLDKARAVLGDDDPRTLVMMNTLGRAFYRLGRLDEAVWLGEETMWRRRAVLGTAHRETLLAMSHLAMAYAKQGRLDEAVQLDEETVQMAREVLGDDHPGTLATINNLGLSYRRVGRFDEEMEVRKEALQKRKVILGDDHPTTLRSMELLSHSAMAGGERAYALELMKDCVEASVRCLGPDHPKTVYRKSCLARWESRKFSFLSMNWRRH